MKRLTLVTNQFRPHDPQYSRQRLMPFTSVRGLLRSSLIVVVSLRNTWLLIMFGLSLLHSQDFFLPKKFAHPHRSIGPRFTGGMVYSQVTVEVDPEAWIRTARHKFS